MAMGAHPGKVANWAQEHKAWYQLYVEEGFGAYNCHIAFKKGLS